MGHSRNPLPAPTVLSRRVLFWGVRFAIIIVLWAAILVTLVAFWRVTSWDGRLFVPHIVRVTIARTLNFILWQMNP